MKLQHLLLLLTTALIGNVSAAQDMADSKMQINALQNTLSSKRFLRAETITNGDDEERAITIPGAEPFKNIFSMYSWFSRQYGDGALTKMLEAMKVSNTEKSTKALHTKINGGQKMEISATGKLNEGNSPEYWFGAMGLGRVVDRKALISSPHFEDWVRAVRLMNPNSADDAMYRFLALRYGDDALPEMRKAVKMIEG